ncbi:MAG: ABC transporter permease subunit [Candidatus Omnitrophica bacterium]|nr:ABC transporter permease subunit [Candidatus Omnitrophota bacterium]
MSKVIAIAARDLKSWLHSFSFYLLAVFFLGVAGYFFWSGLSYFSLVSYQVATNPKLQVVSLNLTEGVLSSFLASLAAVLLLLIPVLTMRSLAEEKSQGTLELLFTYPISDVQIVIGKFLSLLALVFLLVSPTIAYFFLARAVGAKFETVSLLTGYGGLLLVGASFVALGLLMSSLVERQAVSAGIGFAILLFFWIVGWMAEWTSPTLGIVFKEMSLVEHFRDLGRGIVDTKDLAFFILFISFFLFATLSTLEIRTWKK